MFQSNSGFCALLAILAFIFCFVWTNSYLANFVAVTTVKRDLTLETFQQLSENRRYQLMVFDNTSAMEFIRVNKVTITPQFIHRWPIYCISPCRFGVFHIHVCASRLLGWIGAYACIFIMFI